MSIPVYDVGDRRKLIAEVRNEDGDLADPEVLEFLMREPDGVITTYLWGTDPELVKDTLGIFHVYWDCALVGFHHWRYEATGAIAVAEESRFAVRASQVIISS